VTSDGSRGRDGTREEGRGQRRSLGGGAGGLVVYS